jgi:hypothetical protein
MNCEQARELLNGYIDGELKRHERSRVENHLASCKSCKAELAAFRLLQERAQLPSPGPSESLPQRIAAELSNSRPATREVRNMKARLSIAFGVIALAAVAFVALRPTEAYASLDQVKAAIKKAKNMRAVETVRNGNQTIENRVWMRSGVMRIEAAGKPAKIIKGDKTFVLKEDHPTGEGVWQVVAGPTKDEGHVIVDFVLTKGRPLSANSPSIQAELVLDKQEDVLFRVVGMEELDGKQAEKAIMQKPGDPYRTVLWLDPVTKLPMMAERQKKNGAIWDVVSQVRYDFSRPIPPSLLEPSSKAHGQAQDEEVWQMVPPGKG